MMKWLKAKEAAVKADVSAEGAPELGMPLSNLSQSRQPRALPGLADLEVTVKSWGRPRGPRR
jgi:hypothetical protein